MNSFSLKNKEPLITNILSSFGCLAAAMLEIYNLWSYNKTRSTAMHHTKEVPRQSAETGATAGTV